MMTTEYKLRTGTTTWTVNDDKVPSYRQLMDDIFEYEEIHGPLDVISTDENSILINLDALPDTFNWQDYQ